MSRHEWNGTPHRQLRLHLLGPFQAAVNGNPPIRFRLDKCRLLLAYLVLESDSAHSREKLATLLWPSHSRHDARLNLRQTLHQLRRTLDEALGSPSEPLILSTRQAVQFNPGYPCWRDTEELAENLGQERLEEAAALYRDDLLADLAVPGGEFSEWLSTRRATYRQGMCIALERLVRHYLEIGDPERALHFAQRHTLIDPWAERAHRQLMHLLDEVGRRHDAIAHFEQLRALLKSELNAMPEAQTLRLYEQLLTAAPLPKPKPRPTTEASVPLELGHLQQRKLEHLFHCIDSNNDGFIDAQELHRWLSWSPAAEPESTRAQAEALHRQWWENMRGGLDERGVPLQRWFEFWASWQAQITAEALRGENEKLTQLEHSLAARFEVMDHDRDGFITEAEYVHFLSTHSPRENHREAFQRLDRDHDGRLALGDIVGHFREFLFSNDPEAPGNLLYGFPY